MENSQYGSAYLVFWGTPFCFGAGGCSFLTHSSHEGKMNSVAFRVCTTGPFNSGKTSLLRRFVYFTFCEGCEYTIGVAYFTRTVTIRGTNVKFDLFDEQGTRNSFPRVFFCHTSGVVLVYDISNRRSFDELGERAEEVAKYCHELDNESVHFIVLGNKCDLPASRRCVGEDEGRMFAQSIHAVGFFEVSAKDGTSVDAAFCALGEAMLDCRGAHVDVSENEPVQYYHEAARSGSVRLPTLGEAIPQRSQRCNV